MVQISIIIPTLNRSNLIGETLDSIIAQTYQNWECIIVDDGSNDHTPELLLFYSEKHPNIRYVERPSELKKGANACRNYGLLISKGEYVNWFDSDDIMHPDKLKLQIEGIEKGNSSMSVCETLEFSGKIQNLVDNDRYSKIFSENIFEDFITRKIMWLTQAPLWRNCFLTENNLSFDEDLDAGQDWDFHVRALENLENYNQINQPLVFLRKHSKNITNDPNQENIKWNYFKARFKIYHLYKNHLSNSEKAYLLNYMVTSFKGAVRNNHFGSALKILKSFIFKEKNILFKLKIRFLLGYFSFLFFNKGEFLIKGIDIKIQDLK